MRCPCPAGPYVTPRSQAHRHRDSLVRAERCSARVSVAFEYKNGPQLAICIKAWVLIVILQKLKENAAFRVRNWILTAGSAARIRGFSQHNSASLATNAPDVRQSGFVMFSCCVLPVSTTLVANCTTEELSRRGSKLS